MYECVYSLAGSFSLRTRMNGHRTKKALQDRALWLKKKSQLFSFGG
jgi:hypothetical protein